jgi:hypothetical protein
VSNAVCEHAGFARTGTGHNQARTLCGLDSRALHVVELVEVILHYRRFLTAANYGKKVKRMEISADIVFNNTANRIICPNFYNIARNFEL